MDMSPLVGYLIQLLKVKKLGHEGGKKKASILKGLWRRREPKSRVMTEQMWEKVSGSRWEWKVGRVRETEQGGGGREGGGGGAAVEEGKNSMDRQKCGSCENVKEKCVTIKKNI